MKRTRPSRPVIEPEQLPSLLDAAGRLRPIMATLVGTGLRNGEACALDWPDVNLTSGAVTVGRAKTEAGIRQEDLPAALREELAEHKTRARRLEGPVFTNRNRGRQTVSNVERRLKTAIRRANRQLLRIGVEPISEDVTPHSLRRLYASLRFGLGDDPVYVAHQLGHTEPAFSMKLYARAVRRRERLVGAVLREFHKAVHWAAMGSGDLAGAVHGPAATGVQQSETALQSPKLAPSPDSSAG